MNKEEMIIELTKKVYEEYIRHGSGDGTTTR